MITYPAAHATTDLEFCRRVHHAVYRDVVIRQFGSWIEELQNDFFLKTWKQVPHKIIMMDGTPIGTFAVESLEGHLFIHEIQILPEYQGQGIGTQILNEQIEAAQLAGLSLKLVVLRQNKAQALYQRMGFVPYASDSTHIKMEWRKP